MPIPASTIEVVTVGAYVVPTDQPESDGTLEWDSTTMVTVHLKAGEHTGFGYTYADAAVVEVIRTTLNDVLQDADPRSVTALYDRMRATVRNSGEGGVNALAIAAVDNALWDLKSKIAGVPLYEMLGGMHRAAVPLYGSGGFTSYSDTDLREQLGTWADQGFQAVKMKIGRDAAADPERMRSARRAIGTHTDLFVDANAAYHPRQAIAMAAQMREFDVRWFEEPVHHRDRKGLREVRDHVPPQMAVAAGEYGFTLDDSLALLMDRSVDVLQADATRCGITGFMRVAALCQAFRIPLSSHCAPSIHLHACMAAAQVIHMEWFHDHVRLEHMLLDGAVEDRHGTLAADPGRPGIGVELNKIEASKYKIK